MKKILISLLLLVPLFTGCANIDTRVNINDDKSASVVTSLSYSGDLSDKSDGNVLAINEVYNSFIDKSYKTERASGAKFSTITAVKNVKDLSKDDLDLSSLGFVSKLKDNKFIEVRKNFIISSFNVHCLYNDRVNRARFKNVIEANKKSELDQMSSINPEYYHKYAEKSEFDLTQREDSLETSKISKDALPDLGAVESSNGVTNSFSIQVPSIASYNNADSISGNIYTWNLKENEITEIKLQYVQYSGFGIALFILLGVLFLVWLSVKVLRHDARKRIDNIKNIV